MQGLSTSILESRVHFDCFLNTSNHFQSNVVCTTALAKTTNTKLRSYSTCLFTFHACVAPFFYYTPNILRKKNFTKMKTFMFPCKIKMKGRRGSQFYIQLVNRAHFGTGILLFGPFGQSGQ